MIKKITLFMFLFSLPVLSFACGTPQSWLDAIEGHGRNEWMASMNQRESLVMLKNCGSRKRLKREDQLRLDKILKQAMLNRMRIGEMPINHLELKTGVEPFNNRYSVEALIMAIYLRYNCLSDVHSEDYVNGFLSRKVCKATRLLNVIAEGGAFLRYSPAGKKLTSVKNGSSLLLLDQVNDWYRVINPKSGSYSTQKILYVHKSVVLEVM